MRSGPVLNPHTIEAIVTAVEFAFWIPDFANVEVEQTNEQTKGR